jgi:hypothetical protein
MCIPWHCDGGDVCTPFWSWSWPFISSYCCFPIQKITEVENEQSIQP